MVAVEVKRDRAGSRLWSWPRQ